MDKITESMLDSFINNQGLDSGIDESLRFEYFVNYSVINKEYGNSNFDLDDITTGKGAQGIDGIGIIVNQRLVNSTDDIDQLISLNQTISVKFVLIQTKSAEAFDNTGVSNMMTFAKLFFDEDVDVFHTPEMQKFIELKEHIFSNGSKLKKNPELILYYVTLGTWNNDKNIMATAKVGMKSLENLRLFSNISFTPLGAVEIQNLYRKTSAKLSATFKFEKRLTMYNIDDKEIGYIGVLPFKEYKKIIMEENGAVKPVFEDNIRDYLGPNLDVNKSIRESIDSNDANAFCMLNNGVTIVTNNIIIPGDTATIEDYQIVNGCQTSHMLMENCDSESIDNLLIPIRIIATRNEELKNQITKATNSQTAIKKEQLEALSSFQKKLEEYYKTFDGDNALVYERRTGQYRGSSIPKARIVTIPTQIKAVAAMFLNEASAVSGQYGSVAKRVGSKIFNINDKPIMYYASALALYRIEQLFKSGQIDKRYRRCRYHAMMLFRIINSNIEMPKKFNSKKMEKYCSHLLEVLNDEGKCEKQLIGIVNFIVSHGDDIDIDNRKCFERKETTEYLLSKTEELKGLVLFN